MKLNIKKNTDSKVTSRLKKRVRIRKRVNGSGERPRLAVFKSLSHIYAQIIDDERGVTLASASSLTVPCEGKSGKETAELVGKEIAKVAASKSIATVVFDRSGYVYHGRIKALADGAREGGLKF